MPTCKRQNGRWRAYIRTGNKNLEIGTFPTDEEALAAIVDEQARLDAGTSIFQRPPSARMNGKQYSAHLGIPHGTVKRYLFEGLPAARVGNRVMINPDVADPWVQERHGGSVSFGRTSLIYFAARSSDGAVKIGWSSDMVRRLHELRRDERCPVHLLAALPCDKPDEGRLHERFAAHRIDGEWFRPEPELLDFVASLKARAA